MALLALAALTALSALWTVGAPERALRWALVLAGYAALAAAAVIVGRERRGAIVFAMTALTLAACVAGLAGFALREEPLGLHMAGEWQVAGPLEYGPALAVLALGALPVLLIEALRGDRRRAVAGAAGMAVATMTIALASSRLVAALAAALIAATLLAPARPGGATRRAAAAQWTLAAGVPVLLLVVFDPADPASQLGGDGSRLAFVAGVPLAVALARGGLDGWFAARDQGSPSGFLPGAALAFTALIGCAVLGLAAASAAEREGHGVEFEQGFAHGRVAHWEAAGRLIERRPVLGSGGESFFRASRRAQGGDPVLYAHSLPLEVTAELGVAGALAALGFYLGVALELWRRRRSTAVWLFGAMASALLVVNLVDWSWHLAGVGAVWALALGGLIARRPDPTRRPA